MIFDNYKINFEKLLKFGFIKTNDFYEWSTYILNGEFKMVVFVSELGKISYKLFDEENEEYVLHLIKDVTGEFVGKVKAECENVLLNIRDNCYEKEIFKSKQTKEIISYIEKNYGDALEFLWEKFPTDAITRRSDNKKWYALFMTIPKQKLKGESNEPIEVLNVRCKPENIENVVNGENIFLGYHMNKKHWISVCLDSFLETKKVKELIDESYNLAKK